MLSLIIALNFGCSGKHLTDDKTYLATVEKSFNERKQLAGNRKSELFSVFDNHLTARQTEALKYLYAFMPLSDLADYNGEFFLANIDISFRAKDEYPWGKTIPDDIFLHYVLPLRVNNENLDSFRIVYYNELKERIGDKDLINAALEINHWCHEKVSYQAADSRTSAPMSTILSARGRCGEESTFTVAALRTAGIPARQVYTPRWAHSDDNHAWVEIWVDGKWFYMGACEPEPVIDRGWFTEPARRAMLIHTKSFGAYLGNENSINSTKYFTNVNNLAKYAVTKKIFIKVIGSDGLPVNNAVVEYQLYNYAEFYPLAIVPTGVNGISQFETGLGDLLIWAGKGDDFGYKKISVEDTDTLTLTIDRKAEEIYNIDLDLDVPIVRSPLPGPSPELIKENADRINGENIIRQKYIDSWVQTDSVISFALQKNIDTSALVPVITRSMGNYKEILLFLSQTPDSLISLAVDLLESLADKDLRDIKGFILSDHLQNSHIPAALKEEQGRKMYLDYILNPRIANEMVVAWRSYFNAKLPSQLLETCKTDPGLIINYLNNNIKIAEGENYYKTPLTPRGVNELKVSDPFSRSICFVAICRSLEIPARLEPGSNVPQYFFNEVWNDVYFAGQKQPSQKKGFIKFVSAETKPVPEYYIHFTLARFEGGRYNTLDYDYNKKVTDFMDELMLLPGNYMLVTGNRLNDSKILSNISFFNLSENEHKTIEIKLRKDNTERKSLGMIDLNNIITLFPENRVTLEKSIEKGVVIIWIDPDKEPTKHIFNDLPLLRNELNAWGGYFLFLTTSVQGENVFRPEKLQGLPASSLFGTDKMQEVLKKSLKLTLPSDIVFPYVVVAGKNGEILFTSAGYKIGIGEQILKNLQ